MSLILELKEELMEADSNFRASVLRRRALAPEIKRLREACKEVDVLAEKIATRQAEYDALSMDATSMDAELKEMKASEVGLNDRLHLARNTFRSIEPEFKELGLKLRRMKRAIKGETAKFQRASDSTLRYERDVRLGKTKRVGMEHRLAAEAEMLRLQRALRLADLHELGSMIRSAREAATTRQVLGARLDGAQRALADVRRKVTAMSDALDRVDTAAVEVERAASEREENDAADAADLDRLQGACDSARSLMLESRDRFHAQAEEHHELQRQAAAMAHRHPRLRVELATTRGELDHHLGLELREKERAWHRSALRAARKADTRDALMSGKLPSAAGDTAGLGLTKHTASSASWAETGTEARERERGLAPQSKRKRKLSAAELHRAKLRGEIERLKTKREQRVRDSRLATAQLPPARLVVEKTEMEASAARHVQTRLANVKLHHKRNFADTGDALRVSQLKEERVAKVIRTARRAAARRRAEVPKTALTAMQLGAKRRRQREEERLAKYGAPTVFTTGDAEQDAAIAAASAEAEAKRAAAVDESASGEINSGKSAAIQAMYRSWQSRRTQLHEAQEESSLLRRKAVIDHRDMTRFERQHRDATSQQQEAHEKRVFAGTELGVLTARARAADNALPIVTRTIVARELEARSGRHNKPTNL